MAYTFFSADPLDSCLLAWPLSFQLLLLCSSFAGKQALSISASFSACMWVSYQLQLFDMAVFNPTYCRSKPLFDALGWATYAAFPSSIDPSISPSIPCSKPHGASRIEHGSCFENEDLPRGQQIISWRLRKAVMEELKGSRLRPVQSHLAPLLGVSQ